MEAEREIWKGAAFMIVIISHPEKCSGFPIVKKSITEIGMLK